MKLARIFYPAVPNQKWLTYNLPGIDISPFRRCISAFPKTRAHIFQVGLIRVPDDLSFQEGLELLKKEGLKAPCLLHGLLVTSQLRDYFVKKDSRSCWVPHTPLPDAAEVEYVMFIPAGESAGVIRPLFRSNGVVHSVCGESERLDPPTKIFRKNQLILGVLKE